ncbi:MAG: hypothetical protein ACYC7D_05660 [Nitrososphaerales archaeon]
MLLLTISFVLSIPLLANEFTSQASTQSTIVLDLATRPPILPADGGNYASLTLSLKNSTTGMPFIPASNLTVYLTSSSPDVASVPPVAIYPAGAVYVNSNVTTTTLPGTTTVTAVVDGYAPSSANVVTSVTGGMPFALKVFPSPSEILPDKINSSIFVQVVDAIGNPVTLGQDLAVTLTSSDSQIGSVPSSLNIQVGSSFADASFNATYVAGSTIITASAGNLSSGYAVMTTVGPIPRRLVVSVAPGMISSNPKENATLSIQLQDNNTETPAIAPYPVSVVVTSNDTGVVNISSPIVTIPEGQSYVSLQVYSGGNPGKANITASAQGYIKGSTIVNATNSITRPNQVALYFAPGTLLPDNRTYSGAIVEQLQYYDSTSKITSPAVNLTLPVRVYARSSDNSTLQVTYNNQNISAVIPADSTTASFDARTTFMPGTVQITAQSVGLSSDTVPLVSFGSSPNGIRIELTPNLLPSDGQTFRTVAISLINSTTGDPEKAPNNTLVNLAETNSAVGTVQSSILVLAGQTFAVASFTASESPGSTIITASAENFTSTNATLTLVSRDATNLGLYAGPNVIVANGQQYSNIVVQLQDASGNPQKIDLPVQVQLSAMNQTTGSVPSSVTIPAGSTFTTFPVNATLIPGSINVTAFSSGFESAQGGVKSVLLPLKVSVSISPSSLLFRKAANVSVTVKSGSQPISNATVSWPSSETFLSMTNSTNASGNASAVYQSGTFPGKVTIAVKVSKLGYVTSTANASLTVLIPSLPQQTTQPTHSNGLLGLTLFSIPLLYMIPLIAVAPIVAFIMIRRRASGNYVEEEV